MEQKRIKLGVIGCWRGLDVIESSLSNGKLYLRAICDFDREKRDHAETVIREKAPKGDELLLCETYEDLLATDIDAVLVANYAPEHVPFVIKALEAGKHVLSEIPAMFTVEQAKQLKAAVEAHPELTYMAAENCCYWAFIRKYKELYDAGRLGDVVYAEAEYLHAGDLDRMAPLDPNHWRTGLDAIRYITHELGPLLYILNDKPVSVSCMESAFRYNPSKTGTELGAALIRTEKGSIIRILINFGSYVGFDHNYRLFGTKGTVSTAYNVGIDRDPHSFGSFSDTPETRTNPIEIPVGCAMPGEDTSGHGGAEAKMMEDFLSCLLEHRKPDFDVDFAIAMTLPGVIGHESALKGGANLEIPKI